MIIKLSLKYATYVMICDEGTGQCTTFDLAILYSTEFKAIHIYSFQKPNTVHVQDFENLMNDKLKNDV